MTDYLPSLSLQVFTVEGFQNLVNQIGPWGPIAYIGLLIISVVASQIPGAPLAISAGVLWGPLTAGVYTIIGGFLGAVLAYGLGKYLGQSFLQTLTGKRITISPDLATNLMGWFIFVSRLLPVLSFDLVSYGAGMAGLSFPIYAAATLVGMIPSTLLLTYMGGIVDPSQMLGLTGLLLVSIIGLPIVVVRLTGDRLTTLVKIESA
ncbi:conserved hypothetical protein [Acaryochloris marina MBIC11017]|uniref:TVP38/TMEM64 family membrane protein n=2 Tax=Acaryochloris marina TaxID=155978 RepID=B0C3E2_ACAM1|nr:conserved hypothetical protein [Acaryochloris marina MBIC11017]BDM77637.1 hypothetical protein AM10699_05110 [Acaryochloris marina MBIC10699]